MAGRFRILVMTVFFRRHLVITTFFLCSFPVDAQQESATGEGVFATSDQCIACHSNLFDGAGNDVSIGHAWRATMMANSARDPYWHAGVRREIIDHPDAQAAIEDKCSTCHMPIARTMANARGANGKIFDHLNAVAEYPQETTGAWDGVSCTVCHQIKPDNFGEHSSYDGGFTIDVTANSGRIIYGPFSVDNGRQRIMQSASNFTPTAGMHIQKSELCATCHTLFTTPLSESGRVMAQFPEQVPYLEWRQSSYRETHSCQDCHMPVVPGSVRASSVLGEPREEFSQHAFRGGNAFMLRILDRYRDELNVTAPSAELQEAVLQTIEHLSNSSATLIIESATFGSSRFLLDLEVSNLAGHKLPTAYPSRRAWLHVKVTDQNGATIFESGAPQPDGSIANNINDMDGSKFEPHYDEIVSQNQVQIYEPVIYDEKDEVTTGLLHGVRYVKDNRLLPSGFDKSTVTSEVAVQGKAQDDDDFKAGEDRIRYSVSIDERVTSVQVSARLYYQSIGYRWAKNLGAYDSFETQRFVGYYESNADASHIVLAEAQSVAISRDAVN